MKHLRYSIVVMLLVFLVSGCASLVTGLDEELTFNSEPTGAVVTVSGKVVGTTPVSVSIDRAKHQVLTIEKEGYKKHTTQLSTIFNPIFFGNILLSYFGFTGSTVDGLSGAIYEFSPSQYFVTLTPKTPFGISTSTSREIKNLIIAFGSDIRLELASSGGEMTDALLSILGIEKTKKEITIKVLKALEHENKNDLEFAKAIIEFYDVK